MRKKNGIISTTELTTPLKQAQPGGTFLLDWQKGEFFGIILLQGCPAAFIGIGDPHRIRSLMSFIFLWGKYNQKAQFYIKKQGKCQQNVGNVCYNNCVNGTRCGIKLCSNMNGVFSFVWSQTSGE